MSEDASATLTADAGSATGGTLLGSAVGQPSAGTSGQSDSKIGQQSAAVEPFWKDFLRADGTLNHAALDRAPDGIKAHKSYFERHKTLETLLQSDIHAQHLVGKKGLAPVAPDAPAEVKAEFKKRLDELLGVPADVTKYGIAKPEGTPDEKWNGEYVNAVLKAMQDGSVSPATAQKLFAINQEFAAKSETESIAAQEAWKQDQAKVLREEWRGDTAKNLLNAKRVAMTAGITEKEMNENPAFNDATVVRAFANLFVLGREGQFVSGDSVESGQSSVNQINDIMNNPANAWHKPYFDNQDPRHDEAVRRVSLLTQQEVALKKRAR